MEDVYSQVLQSGTFQLAISSILCISMIALYIQSRVLYIMCTKGFDGVVLPDLYCTEWGIHKKLGISPSYFMLIAWPRKITLEVLKMTYNELVYDLFCAGIVVVAVVSIITYQ